MDLLLNIPPLRRGRRLLKITTTTFDALAELHLSTCARFAERSADNLGRIFKAEGIADLVQQQRRQYETLQSERNAYLDSASAIIRNAARQVNELWADPPQPEPTRRRRPIRTAHNGFARDAAPAGSAGVPAAVFELFEDQCGEHRFRFCAGGEELLISAGYKSKRSVRKGVATVRNNAGDDARYERIETDSGLPMFNLKAGNHQIVGTSVPYQSIAAMEAALATLKSASAEADIVDRWTVGSSTG